MCFAVSVPKLSGWKLGRRWAASLRRPTDGRRPGESERFCRLLDKSRADTLPACSCCSLSWQSPGCRARPFAVGSAPAESSAGTSLRRLTDALRHPGGVKRFLLIFWGDGKRTHTKAYMLFLARWARAALLEGNSRGVPHFMGKGFRRGRTCRPPGWSTAHSGDRRDRSRRDPVR